MCLGPSLIHGERKTILKGLQGCLIGKETDLGFGAPKSKTRTSRQKLKGGHNTFYFNQVRRVRPLVSLTSWPITIKEGPDSCPGLPGRDDLNWKDSFASVRMVRQYPASCGGCWDGDDSDQGRQDGGL